MEDSVVSEQDHMAQVKQGLSLDPLIRNTIRLSPARVPDTPGDTSGQPLRSLLALVRSIPSARCDPIQPGQTRAPSCVYLRFTSECGWC